MGFWFFSEGPPRLFVDLGMSHALVKSRPLNPNLGSHKPQLPAWVKMCQTWLIIAARNFRGAYLILTTGSLLLLCKSQWKCVGGVLDSTWERKVKLLCLQRANRCPKGLHGSPRGAEGQGHIPALPRSCFHLNCSTSRTAAVCYRCRWLPWHP